MPDDHDDVETLVVEEAEEEETPVVISGSSEARCMQEVMADRRERESYAMRRAKAKEAQDRRLQRVNERRTFDERQARQRMNRAFRAAHDRVVADTKNALRSLQGALHAVHAVHAPRATDEWRDQRRLERAIEAAIDGVRRIGRVSLTGDARGYEVGGGTED